MRLLSTIIFSLFAFATASAQGNFWQNITPQEINLAPQAEPIVSAEYYSALQLDFEGLKAALKNAPLEFTTEGRNNALQIELPLPDGSMETFAVVASPVLSPGIASRYPSIKTFKGRSISDALTSTRFSVTPRGFHAIISSPEGTIFVDPYARGQVEYYAVYYTKHDVLELEGFELECGHEPAGLDEEHHEHSLIANRSQGAVDLRVYTFGLACSGEYADYHNADTKEEVLSEMVQIVNRSNEVLENDVAVRLVIAENTDEAIFLDKDEDPYTSGNEVGTSYGQTPGILDQYIGNANYDIGHSFIAFCGAGTVGIGGGNACNENQSSGDYKGFGISCQFEPNNAFAVQLVCHEVGHQLNANHTFNLCVGNEENAWPPTSYEPGGGTTIMSYTGACGPTVIQPFADDYYHSINVEEITEYTQNGTGNECAEIIPTDNEMPTVALPYEDDFFIPISTPFQLTAEGSDPDGDVITYSWEQFDLGPATSPGDPVLNSPLFRTYPPTEDPTRVFPRLDKIIANSSDNSEVLPTYSRDLTFRCIVRDNNDEAGGTVWDQVAFRADETAGPFRVTYPNGTGVSWEVGDYQEVTWDVANTTNIRINCNYVNILLSTDGGFTYPYTLVANTPNDGAAFVSVPDAITNEARIRVEASNNIFFDLSNQDFEIAPASEAGFALDVTPASIPLYCLPDDPLSFEVTTASLLDYDMPISLSVSGALPGDASATFGQDVINPGESTTLTIDMGSFSGRDTFNLQLEGTTDDLGTLSRELSFIAVSTDFSGLELLTPDNGTSGVFLTTDFSWTDISGADSYDIEIADSPAFGDRVVESAQGLTEASYTPEILFEDNELYYWRVRPVNECGAGEFLTAYGFHTSSIDCAGFAASDVPIGLPANPNTKTSTIFVPESGTISDLNLEDVVVSFNPVNAIRITLVQVSTGIEVVVFDQNCLNTNIISLSFDDEAPTDIICPPFSPNPVKPENLLSAFDGQDTQGEWQLKVQVVNSGFGSGTINSWNLDFCSTIVAEPPLLVTNAPFPIPSGATSTITTDFLDATDNVSSPSQVKFTLVEVPAHGSLFRTSDPEPLMPGESFTQQTINSWNLSYQHDGSATTEDQFVFVVENNQGGWIPNQTFSIIIDEDATVNTNELTIGNNLSLFPNPAKDNVQLLLQSPLDEQAVVRVINAQGQAVLQTTLISGMQQKDLDTSKLPAGMYLIELQTANNQLSEKLVIQR